MHRREFITLVGGAAAAWPLAARAQQPGRTYVIGMFGAAPDSPLVATGAPAFRDELRKRGFIVGRNLVVEFRSTTQEVSRIYADAAALVSSKVDLIVAIGPELALAAAAAFGRLSSVCLGIKWLISRTI